MGRMSSGDMCSKASPSSRNGPMAASLARAVMSEPENPGLYLLGYGVKEKKKRRWVEGRQGVREWACGGGGGRRREER